MCVPRETSLGRPAKLIDHDFGRTLHVARGQRKALPRLQLDLRLGKLADADLRPLRVGQQRDGKPQLLADALDRFHAHLLLLMRLVRKIDARHVHPRKHQGAQYVFVVGCRAECANDFCLSHFFFLLLIRMGPLARPF